MRASLALVLVAAALVPATAAAQRGTLNRFRPSETPEDDFHLTRPTDLGDLRFAAQLHVDYAANPLVYETNLGDTGSESLSVVGHQLTGTLGLALGLADRVVVFGGLPLVFLQDGEDAANLPTGVAPADGFGLGDAYVGGRVRLFGEAEDVGALALQATVTFPTSIDSTYRGDPFLTFHPELVGELRPGLGSRIVLNVGARLREETDTATAPSNLAFRHELTYGVGFAIPLWTDEGDARTHLDLHAQLYGQSAFAMFGVREGTALEATAGLKLFHASGVVAGLAAGPGLTRGFGSPDVRVIGMLAWMMPAEAANGDRDGDGILDADDACPEEPEDVDTFEDADGCPDPDNDEDGILDSTDECPLEPETVNELDDEDGCPDSLDDQDGDGIYDHVDECPTEPEDADEFQDEDGCPDPDNDGDGVVDAQDGCPLVPGPVPNRGCPDADRDGDTVVDRVDNCPDEPGTAENHGCAEQQQVVIRETGLEILDHVYFRTNRATIQPRSFPLLDNVARVLNAHPELTRIRIEGHTDARGRHDYNVRLSQQRAEAVMRYLVDRGDVEAGRLEAQGFGPDRPVVPDASTPEQHAQNRRVEFNIPDSGIEQRSGGPGSDTIDR